jgi:hypothetical protein
MTAFMQWLKAVGGHWKQELLGGVLIGTIALYSELSGIIVPPRVYEIALVLVLFYAMFLAWRDEYQARLRAVELLTPHDERPDLRLIPIAAFVLKDPPAELPHLSISVNIFNIGAATTLDIRVKVTLKSGKQRSVLLRSTRLTASEHDFLNPLLYLKQRLAGGGQMTGKCVESEPLPWIADKGQDILSIEITILDHLHNPSFARYKPNEELPGYFEGIAPQAPLS